MSVFSENLEVIFWFYLQFTQNENLEVITLVFNCRMHFYSYGGWLIQIRSSHLLNQSFGNRWDGKVQTLQQTLGTYIKQNESILKWVTYIWFCFFIYLFWINWYDNDKFPTLFVEAGDLYHWRILYSSHNSIRFVSFWLNVFFNYKKFYFMFAT